MASSSPAKAVSIGADSGASAMAGAGVCVVPSAACPPAAAACGFALDSNSAMSSVGIGALRCADTLATKPCSPSKPRSSSRTPSPSRSMRCAATCSSSDSIAWPRSPMALMPAMRAPPLMVCRSRCKPVISERSSGVSRNFASRPSEWSSRSLPSSAKISTRSRSSSVGSSASSASAGDASCAVAIVSSTPALPSVAIGSSPASTVSSEPAVSVSIGSSTPASIAGGSGTTSLGGSTVSIAVSSSADAEANESASSASVSLTSDSSTGASNQARRSPVFDQTLRRGSSIAGSADEGYQLPGRFDRFFGILSLRDPLRRLPLRRRLVGLALRWPALRAPALRSRTLRQRFLRPTLRAQPLRPQIPRPSASTACSSAAPASIAGSSSCVVSGMAYSGAEATVSVHRFGRSRIARRFFGRRCLARVAGDGFPGGFGDWRFRGRRDSRRRSVPCRRK